MKNRKYVRIAFAGLGMIAIMSMNARATLITEVATVSGFASSTSGGTLGVGSINGQNTYVGEIVDQNLNFKSIFEFALPDLSGDVGNINVTSGTAKLFVSSSSATQDIHWVRIAADGSVTTADYNRAPLASGLFLSTGGAVGQYITIDVASMIQTALNDVDDFFAIRLETETPAFGNVMHRANVKGNDPINVPANQLPELEFNYEIIPEPGTAVLLLGGGALLARLLRKRGKALSAT